MASLSRGCKLPHFPECTLFPGEMKNKGYAKWFFLGGGGNKMHHGKCGSGVEVNMLATNLTIYLNRKILCSRDLVLIS